MTYVLETRGLTKYYGKVRGIEALDLQVQEGEVFGFLGPNGAGKTTTIRLILDLIRPSRGRVEVFGLDLRRFSLQIRHRLGVISGEPSFYESIKGMDHLALVSQFHRGQNEGRGQELAERFDLDLDRPVRAYSRGMKQKLAIIQALAHDPDLLVLDEPTLGLDPLMQQQFYRLLAEERDRGKTVFLSSHILSEVERICDRVGIVRDGFLAAVLDVEELKHHRVRRMEVLLERDARPEDFQVAGVEQVVCDGPRAEMMVSGHAGEVIQHLATLPLEDVVFPEASLEDAFVRFYTHEEAPS